MPFGICQKRILIFHVELYEYFLGKHCTPQSLQTKIVAVPKTGGNATGDQSDTYRLRGKYGLLYPRGWVLVGLEGVGQ